MISKLDQTLGISIENREDIVCQTKILITYKGFRVDIRDMRWIDGAGFAVSIQFKAEKKWSHGIFTD